MRHRMRLRFGVAVCLPLALLYFAWLLSPGADRQPRALRAAGRRRGVQPRAGARASGGRAPRERSRPPLGLRPGARRRRADPGLRRAGRDRRADGRRGAAACTARACTSGVLDDGDREAMRALARRHGAGYLRRASGARARRRATSTTRCGARARRSSSCSTATTCPTERFLRGDARPPRATPRVAFVQTPQYYANAGTATLAGRGVEPAGAVLRPDRARQGRPRRDVLLRHQRASSGAPRSRTSAASPRAR